MNSQSAPLVNKLILVVLGGILACLVMLVVRVYQPDPASPIPAAAEVTEAASTEAEVPAAAPQPATVARPTAPRPPAKVATRLAEARPSPVKVLPSDPTTSQALSEPIAQPSVPNQFVPVAVAEVVTPVPSAPFNVPIFGTVVLSGTPKPEVPINLGPSCGKLRKDRPTTRHFVFGPEGQLANVLVYISAGAVPDNAVDSATKVPVLDQVGCMFEPYVMAVEVGQPFRIRNSDPELHNIHATPRVNHEFNIGQSRRGQVNERVFDRPELFIRLKCDVHPWMFAYISVMDHSHFAITSTNGFYALPPVLPPGRYTVTAVHLKAGTQSQEIDLLEGESKAVNFVFKADAGSRGQRNVAEARPAPVP